jgi:hypothetical protein
MGEYFKFDSTKHPGFSTGTLVYSCINTGPIRCVIYCTLYGEHFKTDRAFQYRYKEKDPHPYIGEF